MNTQRKPSPKRMLAPKPSFWTINQKEGRNRHSQIQEWFQRARTVSRLIQRSLRGYWRRRSRAWGLILISSLLKSWMR
ncbi:hypothetical protein FGO68_gene4894 [Halteria grandinella]|uniref:Uncharacterized protein n=1 Tax=Halteria grandinella TaxID=5974 RepID=A0A8J8P136_HALGN|nr:hypothetical protein FGO68_gene4894 [Halteria grandinella]